MRFDNIPTNPQHNMDSDLIELKSNLNAELFQLEPIVNMLEDSTELVKLAGIKNIKNLNNYETIKKLRNLTLDSTERLQSVIHNKLHPLEMYYRRKFSYYQNTAFPIPQAVMFNISQTAQLSRL